VRAEFEHQAARDWEQFLSLRAAELLPGGRLVVVLLALDDGGSSGFETIMDHANAVLAEMVTEGAIVAEERARQLRLIRAARRISWHRFVKTGSFNASPLTSSVCQCLQMLLGQNSSKTVIGRRWPENTRCSSAPFSCLRWPWRYHEYAPAILGRCLLLGIVWKRASRGA